MKQIKKIKLFLIWIALGVVFTNSALAQKETKGPVTYPLSYNGNSYTVSEGDTVQIGYGSNPYGSFMYLLGGTEPLDKRYAGQTGIITKINHVKSNNTYWVRIKVISLGKPAYIAQTNQLNAAIDKKEVVKIGEIEFNK